MTIENRRDDDSSSPAQPPIVVAIWLGQVAISQWIPTLVSIAAAVPGARIAICGDVSGSTHVLLSDCVIVAPTTVSSFVNQIFAENRCHVVLISRPVTLPDEFIAPTRQLLDTEMRVSTVSYFTNAGSHLSVPFRNTNTNHQFGGGRDENSITHRLRSDDVDLKPHSIALPAGAVVALSFWAFSASGGLSEAFFEPELAVASWALETNSRGFLSFLDPTTCYATPSDLAQLPVDLLQNDDGARGRLHATYPWFPSLFDAERSRTNSALADSFIACRSLITGLRIGIEAHALGPTEMGTQVSLVELIQAVANNASVAEVWISVPHGLPRYAERLLANQKVKISTDLDGQFSDAGYLDIIHRPYQPNTTPIPWASWRLNSHRIVITLQDLIGYQIGTYHSSGDQWVTERDCVQMAVANADSVLTISNDTLNHVRYEHMQIDASRTYVVPLGTDHIAGDLSTKVPDQLIQRNLAAREFILVLGANYSHKNRDLAVRAWRTLKDRGSTLVLVMVGAVVPTGSSRVREANQVTYPEGDFVVLPDVQTAERNWLLANAAVLLYPSSAEGFGLVPYEAAALGTPTVAAHSGPLSEFITGDAGFTHEWTPDAFADAVERVLGSPDLRAAQRKAIDAARSKLTWAATADGLVSAYIGTLCKPRR